MNENTDVHIIYLNETKKKKKKKEKKIRPPYNVHVGVFIHNETIIIIKKINIQFLKELIVDFFRFLEV